MRSFTSNILKTFASNIIQLISGILIGFFVPKMMGMVGYANYKIYTLYMTYIALTTLGLGDGLYLTFAGKDKDELDSNVMRFYTRKYYYQLFAFCCLGLILSFTVIPNEYRFITIALSLSILSSETDGIHRNFSMLTSRFGEYSKRVVIKATGRSIFVILLYIIFCISGNEIDYTTYIIGVLAIDYILAIWYVFTYKDFNIGHIERVNVDHQYHELLIIGFPLLLSNMGGTIFMSLDRQFVSILFPREDYAVYAFAYNLFALVTTMTSAISLVLFPSMRRIKNVVIKDYVEKYFSLFTILIVFCMSIYYPLCLFISVFLPKYQNSIEILRIVLPGLVLSSCTTVILFNFYKLEMKVSQYFFKTIVGIIFSGIMNYLAYVLFHSYKAISWASIISLVFWFSLVIEYFVRMHKVKIQRVCFYILSMSILFYLITYTIINIYLGTLLYVMCFLVVTNFFYPNEVRRIIESIKTHKTIFKGR